MVGRLRRAGAVLLIACTAAFTAACGRHDHVAVAAESHRAAAAYPRGRWRLARFDEVDNAVLWMSHILVMHRSSQPNESALRLPRWLPDEIPQRSMEEAYRIASDMKVRAQAHPDQFAELAKQYSEDSTSSDRGGSLGGVHGEQLPAPFLDALSVMRPGQVSEVIRTALGFHVLLRRAAPPAEQVRGRRLVVRYTSTLGEQPSSRSRKSALELATSLVQRARAGAPFESLVSEASESRDVVLSGEIGTWWTTDPGNESILVEELARLPVGNVSAPIDTRWGFQILQRLPLVPAADYAMRAVKIEYHPDVAGDEESAAKVAADVATALQTNPQDFDGFVDRYCCKGFERWPFGHGDPELTKFLDGIQIGQIAPVAIRLPYFYVVPQRLDPALVSEPPKPAYDLPAPEFPDIEAAIGYAASEPLAKSVGEFRRATATLDVAAPERKTMDRALDQFHDRVLKAQTYDDRVVAYRDALALLHDGVSESTYARFMDGLKGWSVREKMRLDARVE